MFITRDDYLLFDGRDLDVELPDDDNAKGKVNRFINEVEMFVFNYLRKHGFKREDVNDNNIQDVKFALLYQARRFIDEGRDGVLDPMAWAQLHNAGIVNIIRG